MRQVLFRIRYNNMIFIVHIAMLNEFIDLNLNIGIIIGTQYEQLFKKCMSPLQT